MRRILLATGTLAIVMSAVMLARSGALRDGGSDPVALPDLRALGVMTPRLSPDGTAVAFSYQGAIWRMPAEGGPMRRLSRGEGVDVEPAWTPDQKYIAYVHTDAGRAKLRLIDAQDGTPADLPMDITVRGKLYFHPDGRLLGNFQIGKFAPALAWLNLQDGSMQVVPDPPRPVGRFALSHDGDWVSAVTTLDRRGQQGGNDGPQTDLWKLPAEGGKPEKLVRFPARVYDTCWSADGQALYVTTDLGGVHYDLWKVPLDDPEHGARKLTFGQADEDRPSLSADGRWLLYTDNREGPTALVRRDLQTGADQTLAVTGMDFGTAAGSLVLNTRDAQTDAPVVARVMIQAEGGKYYEPPGAMYRMLRGHTHFYCRGRSELALPVGRYRVAVYRGPEYKANHHNFEIQSGQTAKWTASLERWTHAAQRGWFSGENHIHANYGYGEWYNTPESMLLQCEGEDLNVCNFMVANSDGDGVFDREFFRGRPHPLSKPQTILYWNEEFRSTIWGHLTLVNLGQLVEPVFTGFLGTTNPWDVPTNADVADQTHVQNGLVNFTHPAANLNDPYDSAYSAKSLPLDAALGKVDTIDVMGGNHRATVPLWYRLLNCGVRLPASAGTDCFLNRVQSRLPGGARVYVKIDGAFAYAPWIEGLRAGRSFVSDGPMLELEVEGKGLGELVDASAARAVHVRAKAESQFPMEQVELVYNGNVVLAAEISDDGLTATVDAKIPVERSGWLALRASGPGHPDHMQGELYAHTSPVYVQAGGRPTASPEDAKYFLGWLDRLEQAINARARIPNDALKAHVAEQFEAAKAYYRPMAGNAN